MKKILLMLSCTLMLAAACTPKVVKTAGIDYENMDTTARAGDNFVRYATGNWAGRHPQPPEYPMWGVTAKVYDDNVKALAKMIQDIAAADNKKGSIEQKIGDLYNLAMDTVRLDNEGAAPLLAQIAEIDALQTREEFLEYCAKHHTGLMFDLGVYPDEKDAANNIVCVSQSGLMLGSRDYYITDNPQNLHIRELTKNHMKNLFVLAGYDESDAEAKVATISAIEDAIAVPYYTEEAQRVPEDNYHKISVDSLIAICGDFPWRKFLNDFRYDKTTEVNLCQPEPVAKSCEILMTAPLEDLKTGYACYLLFMKSSLLSKEFTDENFNYNSQMYGNKEKAPRWKVAESIVDNSLSDAIAQMYVKEYFPPQAKAEMLELVSNLKAALAERIKAQEWMCDETKAIALEKLEAYGLKIGYPDKWDDLSGLVVDPSKTLLDNMRAISDFYWNLEYSKSYNKPVDKDEWYMPAHMVNAYYAPTNNEICFPAGILQAPLFSLSSDAAANYGAIGVIIGHEMTHGFDDQGRQYNKEGNLADWWTPADAENFKKPCDQMVDYFNGLWVIPGELKANGTLCLGENLADHGGLNIAYDAFQMWQNKHGRLADDNGFTPEQRFFLSYATTWAGTMSDEILRYLTVTDCHSAEFLRVNGALAQCDAWYDAFNVQSGDSLYVAPGNRVRVW